MAFILFLYFARINGFIVPEWIMDVAWLAFIVKAVFGGLGTFAKGGK